MVEERGDSELEMSSSMGEVRRRVVYCVYANFWGCMGRVALVDLLGEREED